MIKTEKINLTRKNKTKPKPTFESIEPINLKKKVKILADLKPEIGALSIAQRYPNCKLVIWS